MAVKYTNNAVTTLAVGIDASQTSFSVVSSGGSKFPVLGATDWCYVTLIDGGGNMEVVKVTARDTDLFTCVRGADSTNPRSFAAGSRVELRPCAGLINDIQPVFASVAEALAGSLTTKCISPATLAQAAPSSGSGVGDTLYLYDLYGRF